MTRPPEAACFPLKTGIIGDTISFAKGHFRLCLQKLFSVPFLQRFLRVLHQFLLSSMLLNHILVLVLYNLYFVDLDILRDLNCLVRHKNIRCQRVLAV